MLNNDSRTNDQRFRIKELIGKGGMATVFRAVDTEIGEVLAFKSYNHSSINQAALKEAFNREVEALQFMDHPHIVRYIDKGEASGAPFIVMELLPKGIPEWLEARRGDIGGWDDLYDYFAKPLISALKYSHEKKIAHRDIKPSNVRFNDKYELKLIDYNICINTQEDNIEDNTLGSFKTQKYSPDEPDWYNSPYRRDVFGFAAICVEVMARAVNINTDEYQKYSEIFAHPDFDWPDDVTELFKKILNCSHESEYNCIDLFLSIEKIQLSRYAEQDRTSRSEFIPIFISKSVEITRKDLDGYTWISSRPGKGNNSFWLYGTKYQYWVTVEDKYGSFDAKCLVIHKTIEPDFPNEHENIKQSALELNYIYKVNPISGKNFYNIDRLVNDIRVYEKENNEQSSLGDLGEKIESILNRKLQSIRKAKEYKWIEIDGLLSIPELGEAAIKIAETQYVIYTAAGKRLCKVRLKQKSHDLYAYEYIEDQEPKLPNLGLIKEDTDYAKRQYNIGRGAVEKIFESATPNPRLWTILKDPTEARYIESDVVVKYFNENLDSSKKVCVEKFVKSKDFFFVEGPPGTGKTDLIIELLRQQIDSKSSSKILVVSETNVALDNILERLEKLKPKLDYVRIGSTDNKKISPMAQEYLVDKLSNTWKEEIKVKITEYQNRWPTDKNLDVEEIRLFLNLQRYCFGLDKINRLVSHFLENKEKIRSGLSEDHKGDSQESLEEGQNKLNETIKVYEKELESEKKVIQNLEAGQQWLDDIESDGYQCVLELIQTHFDSYPVRNEAKQQIELSNDWLKRFPGSDNFEYVLVRSKQIVFSTTMLLAMTHRYKDLQFDLVILDEASKSALIESVVPLSSGKKWILLGDRKQLPPFVDSDAVGSSSNELEHLSLFNYLFESVPETCKQFLTKQYRMSPGIGKLISNTFYEDKLESGTRIEDNNLLSFLGKEIVWIDTSKEDSRGDHKSTGGSFTNPLEVKIVEKVFMSLERHLKEFRGLKNRVLVISGYSGQVDKLKQRLGNRFRNFNYKVNTIDACQGHEADIVLFSIVRSNIKGNTGFISEMERLNVGLSRARKVLIIIGDLSFCHKDTEYLGDVATFVINNPSICLQMLHEDFAGGL